MIKFEKVSFEEYAKAMKAVLMPCATEEDLRYYYDAIKLPKRGTKASAGYDIFSPISFELLAGIDVSATIPTGIRAVMPSDMFLLIVPRSGIGFKTGACLANTVGVIDSDYIEADSEGHIMIKMEPGFDNLNIKKGDRFAQGIFLKYYTTDDDESTEIRKGGFGSTGV